MKQPPSGYRLILRHSGPNAPRCCQSIDHQEFSRLFGYLFALPVYQKLLHKACRPRRRFLSASFPFPDARQGFVPEPGSMSGQRPGSSHRQYDLEKVMPAHRDRTGCCLLYQSNCRLSDSRQAACSPLKTSGFRDPGGAKARPGSALTPIFRKFDLFVLAFLVIV